MRAALLDSLSGHKVLAYSSWRSLPYVGLQIDAAALRQIIDSPYVTTIQEDSLSETHTEGSAAKTDSEATRDRSEEDTE